MHVVTETRILEMWKFDLRFVILLIINIAKSHPWAWDPFEVTTDFSWIKFWLLTSLMFIFGFIFIGMIPSNSPNNNVSMRVVRIQINNFSPYLFLGLFVHPAISLLVRISPHSALVSVVCLHLLRLRQLRLLGRSHAFRYAGFKHIHHQRQRRSC